MKTKSFRRMLVLAGSILILVLAFAPASFAGGCDDDEEDCGGGSGVAGSTDSGSASGGVATGLGGMASVEGGKILLPLTLAGGAVVLLTAAGGLAVRRQDNQ